MTELLLFNCDLLLTTTIELLLSHLDEFYLLSNLATLCQALILNENHPPDVVVMGGGVNALR